MKAAMYYGPRDVRIEEMPEPEVKPGQVKVKVAWNGLCGSDLHYFTQKASFLAESVGRSEKTLPFTLGHEFSGTIVSIGDGVDGDFKVGQNVTIVPGNPCRKPECYSCSHEATNVCPATAYIGGGGPGGGLCEYVAVDARLVHILPEGISLEVGAMMEPLAVAWHAVKRAGFKDGQSVLVVGAGPIGLFLLKVLRSFGPKSTIIISEPAQIRRELASKHGATLTLDPSSPSDSNPVVEAVMRATNGVGVDIAFDATGIEVVIDTALRCVHPHGMLMNLALWEKKPVLDMNLVVLREITVTGSAAYHNDHTELIKAVAAGKLPGLEDLVTRRIAIEDVVEQGLKALIKEKDSQVKILVHP